MPRTRRLTRPGQRLLTSHDAERAREGWRRIVAHNRYDLDDTRAICVAVARDLETVTDVLRLGDAR